MSGDVKCVRGAGGRGKEHIGAPPEIGTMWSRTACGLTCRPQFPGLRSQASAEEKCLNCRMFHEIAALATTEDQP